MYLNGCDNIKSQHRNNTALSIGQIQYLEDLIYDYSFDKSKRNTWNKIKRFFFNDELPEHMIDLIDEIYHNLNQHGRQLLKIALTSKKST